MIKNIYIIKKFFCQWKCYRLKIENTLTIFNLYYSNKAYKNIKALSYKTITYSRFQWYKIETEKFIFLIILFSTPVKLFENNKIIKDIKINKHFKIIIRFYLNLKIELAKNMSYSIFNQSINNFHL